MTIRRRRRGGWMWVIVQLQPLHLNRAIPSRIGLVEAGARETSGALKNFSFESKDISKCADYVVSGMMGTWPRVPNRARRQGDQLKRPVVQSRPQVGCQ
jgi:hypothetical protein